MLSSSLYMLDAGDADGEMTATEIPLSVVGTFSAHTGLGAGTGDFDLFSRETAVTLPVMHSVGGFSDVKNPPSLSVENTMKLAILWTLCF